jgi:nitrogenase molybdenum-iron protein alpha/beta subunit
MSLIKFLSPFAPDQSGAAAALYELGGLIVICDAGGCTGNICGFDEPRWFYKKSAVFSAGLRDMDAILGRDERLVSKLQSAANQIHAEFAAIISTPVPAVIATDFRAIKHMVQKRTGLPAICIEATGTNLYDEGEESALLELFKTFAVNPLSTEDATAGVLGVTPLDFGTLRAGEIIEQKLKQRGFENVYCYGMGSGLDSVRRAAAAKINFVVSPAGLKSAQYLKETFGTPYTVCCPAVPEITEEDLRHFTGKRILIIHQQVFANELRQRILEKTHADVTVATWFMLKDELKKEQDIKFTDEKQFIDAVESVDYDIIIGDIMLKHALNSYKGEFIDLPHFAVSGRIDK